MSHDHQNETIYALATPSGRSGVAIIRVSGSNALLSLKNLNTDINFDDLKPRYAYFTSLKDNETNKAIDKAVIIYFKAPNSFTGEDIVEYHLHGSPAVIDELSEYMSKQPNHRPAERGEFTRRGFENNRMDLTEAEAIADLIDAETTLQKDQALSQMSGSLRDLYEGWATQLTRMLAHLEADLDFPDEDLPDGVANQAMPKIESLKVEIARHLNDNRRGERLRNGIKIAVIGAPNAGKSSLVNAIAQRDIAIISDLAGTTRDVLEVHLNINGYPVILQDTAGLKPELLNIEHNNSVSRETLELSAHDQIESEGIKRALNVAQQSDIQLLIFDACNPLDEATYALKSSKSLLIRNKCDVVKGSIVSQDMIDISVKTEKGFEDLFGALSEKIKLLIGHKNQPTLTRQRHRHQLNECVECLERALTSSRNHSAAPELIAEDVRLAVRALGRITGRVDVDDLLDLIFSEFCIGK